MLVAQRYRLTCGCFKLFESICKWIIMFYFLCSFYMKLFPYCFFYRIAQCIQELRTSVAHAWMDHAHVLKNEKQLPLYQHVNVVTFVLCYMFSINILWIRSHESHISGFSCFCRTFFSSFHIIAPCISFSGVFSHDAVKE